MANEHVDVLIIGAGVSGIGAACHLTRECPSKSYAILERRTRIGGTWDLFRYPGIRSDSDMFTFGYRFRPWNETKVLADGASIQRYVSETAAEYGVDKHIRYGRRAIKGSWSSQTGTWTVVARNEATGRREQFTANFVIACSGYYDYDNGYRPRFPGEEDFAGPIIHPQHWPEDLDYAAKKVVIIGSGATAVTLVPAMAEQAANVTMLQRSPTYVLSLPAEDMITKQMRRVLPDRVVFGLARRRNIMLQRALYTASRSRPDAVRSMILTAAKRQLHGRSDIANFTPSYDPWDQRMCIVPDGDLFKAIASGKADIVTDHIARFVPGGIELESGKLLEADVVIAATGLNLQLLGGADLDIDGESIDVGASVTYKSVLVEGVPNASLVFGYTNASWTLKADLASEYTCRLINYMSEHGYDQVVAHATAADRAPESVLSSLTSGYVRRGDDQLPRQGTGGPWRVRNDYLRDIPVLRRGPVADGVLQFSRAEALATVAVSG